METRNNASTPVSTSRHLVARHRASHMTFRKSEERPMAARPKLPVLGGVLSIKSAWTADEFGANR